MEKYTSLQGQYPVIMLTLKSAKQPTFEMAYAKLRESIAREFYRYDQILEKLGNVTGLNNLKIISILNEDYGEYYGFIENEVREMLKFYGREHKMDTMKEWYDGYLFGNTEVYNPWSVINYTEKICTNENAFPTAEWSNTSSNSIIRDLIQRASGETKIDIEALVNGMTIEKKVHEDITYDDIYESEENLWNFLFFTGYLKSIEKRMVEDDIYIKFAIPNKEVKSIYRNQIEVWFRKKIEVVDLSNLYEALLSGNTEALQEELEKQLQSTISYMDSYESFYHGFLLGLLANLKDYLRKSNREAGLGRYDICVYTYDEKKPAIIMELKVSKKYKDMEADAAKALKQIDTMQYDAWLPEEGYTQSIRYGIAFYKKRCRICMERKEFEI